MADLGEIINSPEQKSAEFWQLASRIVAEHIDLLRPEDSLDGQERLLVTPSFVPGEEISFPNPLRRWDSLKVAQVEPADKSEEDALAQSYSIAAQIDPRKGYQKHSPLYLIINENTTTPLLQFDRQTSRLIILNGSFAGLENSDQTVGKILKYIDKAMDAKQKIADFSASIERAAQRRRRRTVATVTAGLLLVGSGVTGVRNWRENLAEDNRLDRQAFDASDVNIDSPGITIEQLAFVRPAPDFFAENDVPERSGNEPLVNPRLLRISEGVCQQVVVLGNQEQLHLVTDAPKEKVYAVANSAGSVQVCALKSPESPDDAREATFEVAAQVTARRQA